jgi:hypothetical protein
VSGKCDGKARYTLYYYYLHHTDKFKLLGPVQWHAWHIVLKFDVF